MTHTRAIYSPSRQAILLANENGFLELDVVDAAELSDAIAAALAMPARAEALLRDYPREFTHGCQ